MPGAAHAGRDQASFYPKLPALSSSDLSCQLCNGRSSRAPGSASIIHITSAWIPTYLSQRWGLPLGPGMAVFLFLIYLGMDLGFIGGGAVISYLVRRGVGAVRARKVVMAAAAGLVVALLTALVAVVVYLTGEPAEELVENLPGISEAAMETHEEIALVATLVLGAFAIVALYGLFAFRHGVSMGFTRVLLILSLFPLATMAYTAYLGGQIRHSEIRPAAAGAPGAESAGEAEDANQGER